MRQHRVKLLTASVHDQRIASVVSVQVAQNVSLRIQHKGIYALPLRQVADIIGDHTVQPAHPVATANGNLSARPQIEDSAA